MKELIKSGKAKETKDLIVSVKGKTGFGIKMRAFDLVAYSNYNDSIWKTIVKEVKKNGY